jgi:hypothetical protein
MDKTKELLEFFKVKMTKHIKEVILVELESLEGEHLIKTYMKEWENFTLFSHFMRRMFR